MTQLDPAQTGSAQVVYSTFVGGSGMDCATAVDTDVHGHVTIGGSTISVDFPTSRSASSASWAGGAFAGDGFISRLDPRRPTETQLRYSPSLVGQSVFAQFLWTGPTAPPTCPSLGMSTSHALRVTIQP